MKIIKKDGRLQEFDKNKIFISIENASRDTEDAMLNESDLKILVEDIVNKIYEIRNDETSSSSYEIIGVMVEILLRDGFNNVVKSFIEHE